MTTTSVTFNDLRINNAEQLKESVSEPSSSNIYLTIGKTTPWANDNAPDAANSSIATIYEVWDNMIGGKRLVGSDISHVVPRFNWQYGQTYPMYDHLNSQLTDGIQNFYVINSNYDVYKCLSNNYSSPSTIEPTSVKPGTVTITTDNYHWKYMYSLSDVDLIKFTTDSYIPVRTLVNNDGSTQWQVQSQAKFGTIEVIEMIDGGNGYSNVANIVVTVTGDGSGVIAVANVTNKPEKSNTIDRITIINPGLNYTYANVSIRSANGSGAIARAIISPPGGHGSDPLYELGGKNLMINVRLKGDEEQQLTSPVNDFRQIALIKDPKEAQGTNTMSASAFTQAYTLTLFGSGDYAEDELVYQGANLNTSTFSGRVVSWDETQGTLKVINIKGTPTLVPLIGSIYSTSRTVTSIQTGSAAKNTGRILYVDNIKPITRSADQIEDFKILIKF